MTADPWRWEPPPPLVRWRSDGPVAVLTTVLVALTGAAVGLIWSAISPKLSLPAVVAGSEAPFKAQIAADGRFLLLGIAAGVLCAAVLLALGQRGPGAVVGLAVGGVLAALVANRVGVVAQHDATLSSLRSLGLAHTARVFDLVGFRVRAMGVLLGWPLAAVLVYGLASLLQSDHH